MADSFSTCLDFTLQAEGGWVDDPRDAGGCTQHGITLSVFREWKDDPQLTCDDLQVITSDEINAFYQEMFWLPIHAQSLPLGVDLMIFDAGVNMGVSRSVKILQSILNVTVDGAIGIQTLAATFQIAPITLITSLAIAQTKFYESLSNFDRFGTGWLNRVHTRQLAATDMVSK
jgi:lysozyme family protein